MSARADIVLTERARAIALRGERRLRRIERVRHARNLATQRRAYARRRAAANRKTARDETRRIVASMPDTVRAAYDAAGRKLRRLIVEQRRDECRWTDKYGLSIVGDWL